MKVNHLFLTSAFFALVAGCRESRNSDHVVIWNDGVALYSVVYTIDGDEIGRGRAAYEDLIRRLEALPDGSRLKFKFPADIAGVLLDRTQREEPLPFDQHEPERMAFDALLLQKKFIVSFEGYVPVEYVR